MSEQNRTAPRQPAVGALLERGVGRPEPERAGLHAQIAACRREVASWPQWMRTVAVLRLHPAAMDGDDT